MQLLSSLCLFLLLAVHFFEHLVVRYQLIVIDKLPSSLVEKTLIKTILDDPLDLATVSLYLLIHFLAPVIDIFVPLDLHYLKGRLPRLFVGHKEEDVVWLTVI